MSISLSPFAPEKLVSPDGFGRPSPHQTAHSPYILSQAESAGIVDNYVEDIYIMALSAFLSCFNP